MRAFAILLLCCLLAGAAAAPARADETPSSLPTADRDAIKGVIQGQIGAFRSDDASAAYGFASPSIQALMGDAGHFLEMVRHGYAPVYRPRSVTFGALIEVNGQPVQKVVVIGPDGRATLALYYMEQEHDGTWRIDGCVLTESEDVGA
jgi:hypothetical protein